MLHRLCGSGGWERENRPERHLGSKCDRLDLGGKGKEDND